jgi:hypothetical protein
LVGMPELFSSVLVELSISNSSNKYSALRKSLFKEIKEIKKIIKDIDLGRFMQKSFIILFNFKIL